MGLLQDLHVNLLYNLRRLEKYQTKCLFGIYLVPQAFTHAIIQIKIKIKKIIYLFYCFTIFTYFKTNGGL